MKKILIFFLVLCTSFAFAQKPRRIIKKIAAYQASESEKFASPETSILTPEDLATFTVLEYYPINLKYRVQVKFVRTPSEKPFLMPTTTDRLPEYVKYGEAHFTIDDKEFVLSLFQNTTPSDDPEYIDYLFLPFTDLTSGDGSYGGGRYLDARIPKDGKTMILDFNKSYNPYCAYNSKYSCPIPPEENDLLLRLEAGIKDFGHH